MPMIEAYAPQGVSYGRRRAGAGVQDRAQRHARRGDREPDRDHAARQQDGRAAPRVPRLHQQFRDGLDVHRYKSPALVNLDWTTTFTPELLRKDLDLGLALGRDFDVPMPVTAAAREMLQSHFGAAILQKNPEEYLQKDFAALAETMALAAGMKLESENKNVPSGLET
jgi:3-hydroxyisobutyrate dehydrogenase